MGIVLDIYKFLCNFIDVIYMNVVMMNFNIDYYDYRIVNVLSIKEFIKFVLIGV